MQKLYFKIYMQFYVFEKILVTVNIKKTFYNFLEEIMQLLGWTHKNITLIYFYCFH